MDFLDKLNVNQVVNLYVMYNEVFLVCLRDKDFDSAKKCFLKIIKYFDVVCKVGQMSESELLTFVDDFEKTKQKAQQELKVESFEYEDAKPDAFENFLMTEDLPTAFEKIAQGLSSMGAHVSAVNFLNDAVSLNPTKYENYILLGDYNLNIKDYKQALICYHNYTQYCQNNPKVYDNMGILYSKIDRYAYFDEKFACFNKALELDPNYKDALRHLAILYRNSGDNQKCLEIYGEIIKLNPTNDDYFNYSLQNLHMGNFEEGLKYYGYRFLREQKPTIYPHLDKPKWDGAVELSDKTLLVHFEQGFGDSIQFFRYLLQVKAKYIIFRVQDALVDLFKTNTVDLPNIEVIGKSNSIEKLEYDYHVPLADLLSIFGARIDNIILPEAYLKADENLSKQYKENFFNNDCFKIGISWQGAKGGNPYRDVSLTSLLPLAKLKNVKLYSVQKEVGDDFKNLQAQGIEIVDLGSGFRDFSDTAATVASLDLVISCDNVITNLAGAMGKKTFLLLNKDSDWRWFTDEHKSPWYDSVKIFKKQDENDAWDITVQNAVDEILKLM